MSIEKLNVDSIIQALIVFLQEDMGVSKDINIPLDESLLGAGIIDSFAIIELAEFIERNWQFKIDDADFTGMNFGSLNKIANFIVARSA